MMNLREVYKQIPEEIFEVECKGVSPSWCDGEMIMCWDETVANKVADYLDENFYGESVTGYYDPDEDIYDRNVDHYTGWWYVTL